jgi:hypothetical protein
MQPTIAFMMTEEEEREKWQKRENKAQGMLNPKVSLVIKLDLDDLKSATDMWGVCEHLYALNMVGNQREVRRKLYSVDLDDDATSEEMEADVELFSRLIMETKLVGFQHTSHERAAMFVWTILGKPYRAPRSTDRLITSLPLLLPGNSPIWQAVLCSRQIATTLLASAISR